MADMPLPGFQCACPACQLLGLTNTNFQHQHQHQYQRRQNYMVHRGQAIPNQLPSQAQPGYWPGYQDGHETGYRVGSQVGYQVGYQARSLATYQGQPPAVYGPQLAVNVPRPAAASAPVAAPARLAVMRQANRGSSYGSSD